MTDQKLRSKDGYEQIGLTITRWKLNCIGHKVSVSSRQGTTTEHVEEDVGKGGGKLKMTWTEMEKRN